MASRLRALVLLVRDVELASNFYVKGLKLPILHREASTVDLLASSEVTISLQQVEGNEAALCVGYSPFINFDVKDMDEAVPTLLQLGGQLDGPVQYEAHGKVAAVRSPDGHMVGLFEASSS